jgi:hypothetical protein
VLPPMYDKERLQRLQDISRASFMRHFHAPNEQRVPDAYIHPPR